SLLPQLQSLSLGGNSRITAAGIRSLVNSPAAGALECLDFWTMMLSDEAACAIGESPHLRALRKLWLGFNRIRPPGASALRKSPHPVSLRRLHLASNRIGNEGAEALLASPLIDRLTFLGVESNRIDRALQARLREKRGTRTFHI